MRASSSWIGSTAATPRLAPDTTRKACSVFAAFANVGYGHLYPVTDHAQPGRKPADKGKVIMGDKSPKSVQKQAAQKRGKAKAAAQKKQQAAAAKQIVGKK